MSNDVNIKASAFSALMFQYMVLLVMYASMQLYFTWYLPKLLIVVASIVSSIFYIHYNRLKITENRLISAALITLVFLYEGLFIYPIQIVSYVGLFARILMVVTLIFSESVFQEKMLKFIIRITAVMIAVSLVFWILFLLGFRWSHYYTLTNNFYTHTVYYFFLLNDYDNQLIPRFAGLFLEPGHIGSTACLLLFLNGVSLKKWENIVFLLAIFFSLSLAAYGLLVGCFALHYITKTKKILLKLIPYIILLAGTTMFFMNYKGGDNPVNELILMRLVFEDGEMSGSNRTSSLFDSLYDDYIESSTSILGTGRESFGKDLLIGCATWKRYFFIRGYVGCGLLMLFLLYYLRKNKSKEALAFFILYIVCNCIRDYPIDELWLYLIILSSPVYRYRNNKQKENNEFKYIAYCI